MDKRGDETPAYNYIIAIVLGIAFFGVLSGCAYQLKAPNCDLNMVDLHGEFVEQYQNCEDCEFEFTNIRGDYAINLEEHPDGVLIYLECFGRTSDNQEIVEGNVCFYDGSVKLKGEEMSISHSNDVDFVKYKYTDIQRRDIVRMQKINDDVCFVENQNPNEFYGEILHA